MMILRAHDLSRGDWRCGRLAARDSLDAADQEIAIGLTPYDDQDRVIPSDGAEDFRPFLHIDGFRDSLGCAGQGLHDDEVTNALGVEQEVRKQAIERGGFLLTFAGGRVVAIAFRVGDFGDAQFSQVAGEGGLGDPEALSPEQAAQFFLAMHAPGTDEFEYGGLSFSLQFIASLPGTTIFRRAFGTGAPFNI